MKWKCALQFAIAIAMAGCLPLPAIAEEIVSERQPLEARSVMAVDHVCAWPNLTRMPDGLLVATIFNQPCHASCAGDVDCWGSLDGATWNFLGKPAPHEPDTNRMNVAAGVAANGDLIVISSGWSGVAEPGRSGSAQLAKRAVLDAWVCRSADQGKTWTHAATFANTPDGYHPFIPFGDLFIAEDGSLRGAAYAGQNGIDERLPGVKRKDRVWMIRSDDDGRHWSRMAEIADGANETALLRLPKQKWLAATRTVTLTMDLHQSSDDGKSWERQGAISGLNEINGHLLQLTDGRLLYTYGSRVSGSNGVLAKLSSDDGKHWSSPVRIVDVLPVDCGYPSSAQLPDESIVTVWYAMKTKDHPRYHMGATTWKPPLNESF